MNLKNPTHFLLFLALGIIFIAEVVLITDALGQSALRIKMPFPKSLQAPPPPPGSLAVILAENQTVSVNTRLQGQVVFDAQEEPVAGADVILTFDPRLVSLDEITANPNLFEQVVVNRHQEKEGQIKITAYLPKNSPPTRASLVSFTFRLFQAEPTVLAINFLGPNASQDSNLISASDQTDLLGQVSSLVLNPER